MTQKLVYLSYSKKTDRFLYADVAIGGAHFVKKGIADQIKTQMPKKLVAKKTYAVEIKRNGRVHSYAVKVIA